ncbi:MAG: hypothetical protein HY823_10430 [Acidobacteria bacterium]|nr:hypothetical protein [Acidobacteriota bacterium]
MQSQCVIVEFIGIPYSKKTSTIIDLEGALAKKKIQCKVAREYRGSDEFYTRNKYSPMVNLLRAVHAVEEIIELTNNTRVEVVLIDRGLVDAQVWFHWFSESQEIPAQFHDTIGSLKKLSLLFCQKYRVVWMDRNPDLANNAHGHQGRIINLRTLSQLKLAYELVLPNVEREFVQYHVDSNEDSSSDIAARLISQLKLA